MAWFSRRGSMENEKKPLALIMTWVSVIEDPRIATEETEACFMRWVRAIKREIIAADGKTVKAVKAEACLDGGPCGHRNEKQRHRAEEADGWSNEYLEKLLFQSQLASEPGSFICAGLGPAACCMKVENHVLRRYFMEGCSLPQNGGKRNSTNS
jgi:hypothetical protein